MKKIIVGSKNPVKVNAVSSLITQYEMLKNAEVSGIEVPSLISEQPKSLEETVRGAKNRALGAFIDCDLSIGIESGLMEVAHSKSGYIDFCACMIYDGTEFHLGLSSGFECPKVVIDLVMKEGLDLNAAFLRAGFTDDPKSGSKQGVIAILSKGRITRQSYTQQAIMNALMHIENAEMYKKQ